MPVTAPRFAGLIVTILFLLSTPCRAQWTIAGYIGGVHTQPADLDFARQATGTDLTFPDTPFRSESLDSPLYYGYRIGKALYRELFFVEGELIHAKAYAQPEEAGAGAGRLDGQLVVDVPLASVVQRFAMSHGLNLILVNAAFRRHIGHSRAAVVARAGLGPVLAHGETEIDGDRREDYQWAGVGLQAAGGLELRLWRGLHGLLEYKFTRARPQITVGGGSLEVTTLSHHVAIGASWTSRP